MTDNSKGNIEFTAQDFERYYNGQMSPEEMHRLEKAAMEDPFLADALEGYQYTASPVEDKKFLHAELQSKTGKGKVVPIRKFGTSQFLRIAALFILLAGCGWAVYQFGFNQTNKDLATAKEIKTPPPSLSAPAADSNNTEADLTYSTTNNDSNKQVTTLKENNNGSVSISTQNRHTGKVGNGSMSKQSSDQPSEKQALEEVAIDDRMVTSSEASIRKVPGVLTDTNAYTQQTVTPGKENVIVMQRTKTAPIPEVVLSNKKRDSNYRKPHVVFEEAEPAAGNESYDDYVASNLQMPEEKLQRFLPGEVKLSFDINDAGQAINIEVEKSLCTECDKEAIRLLKEGPKLVKKKKDKKGKLRIQF